MRTTPEHITEIYNTKFKQLYNARKFIEAINLMSNNPGLLNCLSPSETQAIIASTKGYLGKLAVEREMKQGGFS
jgi:hypothetical protein